MDALVDSMACSVWRIVPESILYGMFSILVVLDAYVIATRRELNDVKGNRPVLSVVSLMFIVSTVHIVSSLCQVYFGNREAAQLAEEAWDFVQDKGTSSLATPSKLHSEIWSLEVVQMASFAIQVWLGDGFMLYRLWKVWNNDWRVTIPISIGFFVDAALGIVLICGTVLDHVSNDGGSILGWWYPVLMSAFAASFVVHFSCTVMIAVRIVYFRRQVTQVTDSCSHINLVTAAVVILESGAIYSIAMLFLLITSKYIYNTSYYDPVQIVMNAVVPLTGITFSLIIVRMGLGISAEKYLKAQRNTFPLAFATPANDNVRVKSAENDAPDLFATFDELELGLKSDS